MFIPINDLFIQFISKNNPQIINSFYLYKKQYKFLIQETAVKIHNRNDYEYMQYLVFILT